MGNWFTSMFNCCPIRIFIKLTADWYKNNNLCMAEFVYPKGNIISVRSWPILFRFEHTILTVSLFSRTTTVVQRPFSRTIWVSWHRNVSILDFIGAKDDEGGGDNWSCKTCEALVKSSPPTYQYQTFYRPDDLPVAQPTVWTHWREPLQPYIGRKWYGILEFNVPLDTV